MLHKEVMEISDETREAIDQMEQTEGWQMVKQYIDGRIADHTKQLITCDLDHVLLHRKSIETLKLIYTHIEDLKKPPIEF